MYRKFLLLFFVTFILVNQHTQAGLPRDIDGDEIKTTRFLAFLRGPSGKEKALHYIHKAENFLDKDKGNGLLHITKKYIDKAKEEGSKEALSKELNNIQAIYYYKIALAVLSGIYTDENYEVAEEYFVFASQYGYTQSSNLLQKIKEWKKNYYIEEVRKVLINTDYNEKDRNKAERYIDIAESLGYESPHILRHDLKKKKGSFHADKIHTLIEKPYTDEKEKAYQEALKHADEIKNDENEEDYKNQTVKIKKWKSWYFKRKIKELINAPIEVKDETEIKKTYKEGESYIDEVKFLEFETEANSLLRDLNTWKADYYRYKAKEEILFLENQLKSKKGNANPEEKKVENCLTQLEKLDKDSAQAIKVELAELHRKKAEELYGEAWMWDFPTLTKAKEQAEIAKEMGDSGAKTVLNNIKAKNPRTRLLTTTANTLGFLMSTAKPVAKGAVSLALSTTGVVLLVNTYFCYNNNNEIFDSTVWECVYNRTVPFFKK